METRDTRQDEPLRVEDKRRPDQDRKSDAARTKRTLTHMVDPYDMRAEPQPEEPGYGHGV